MGGSMGGGNLMGGGNMGYVPAGGRSTSAGMYYGNPYASNVYYPQNAFLMNAGVAATAGATRQQVMESVRKQIDYYFSLDNLCKDIFLRSKMDDAGWIPVVVIANFNRVRMLTPDLMLIVDSLKDSSIVEVSKDNAYIRARENHAMWVLPPQQRDLSHNPPARPAAAAPDFVGGSRAPGAGARPDVPSHPIMVSKAEVAATTAADAAPSTSGPGAAKQVAAAKPPLAKKKQAASAGGELDEEDLFEMDEVGALEGLGGTG